MRDKDLSDTYVGTVLASRQLGVSPVTIQRWSDAKRHGLRSVRYGGRRLLFRADVEALVRERAKTEAAMKK